MLSVQFTNKKLYEETDIGVMHEWITVEDKPTKKKLRRNSEQFI